MNEPSGQRHHVLVVIAGVAAGTGTFCTSLGAGLRKFHGEAFKVSLLTFRPDAKKPEVAANFDETHILSSAVHNDWRRAFDLPRGLLKLRKAIQEIQPDLIFTIGTFSNVVTSLATDQIPVVLSDHLNMTQRLSGARLGWLTAWFMRRTYQDHLMIVASRDLADDLRQNFGARRITVIPNGIDSEIVRRRADEPASPLAVSRYFIAIGRMTEQKDFSTLLRAFAMAQAEGMTDDLVIAGDGEQRTMLESLSRELGIAPKVHFPGHCPNPYPLIKNARALVLSSIWEGFAYAPIEAMALGVPVISTACPSGPVEILGKGEFGLLVPPRDPQHLAVAMLKLSRDDSLHANLVNKSSERADQLSIQKMVCGYRSAFLAELKNIRDPAEL